MSKKLLATLILVNSSLFAGSMGPLCDAENVTISCKKTGWNFGAQALHLQSVYSGVTSYYAWMADPNDNKITKFNSSPTERISQPVVSMTFISN